MKSKSITVYSIIISIIFTLAVTFFCYNLVHEYRGGAERAELSFRRLVSETQSTIIPEAVNDEEFRQLFNDALATDAESFDFASVRRDGEFICVSPSAQTVLERESVPAPMTRGYIQTIQTSEGTYTISGGLYLIRPAAVFYHARFAFIIILAGTILTVVLIIYTNITASRAAAVQEENFSEDTNEASENSDSVSESDSEAEEKNTENIEINKTEETESSESNDSVENAAFSELTPDEPEPVSQEQKNDNEKMETGQPAANTPQGLFSPATGFGWESYLEPRLDSELVRAASSEQDLVIFIIRISGMTFSDSFVKSLCNYLLETFQFNDLLFEYGTDGFAAIKTNTSIDEAVPQAEDIHAGIVKVLEKAGAANTCTIGLSSRSVRLMPAKRLITEAVQALEHASEDKSNPIIAFRANADKYRQFVEKNS